MLLLVLPVAVVLAAELATVITDAQIAKLAENFGPVAKQRLVGWRDIVANPKYKNLPERQKLELVNDF